MTKHTPLYDIHEQLGASFTDFGGWEMPLKYQNELDEHRAVRGTAGLFDLSHMGEVRVKGAQAGDYLDYAMLSKYSTMKVGKAKYGLLIDENGHLIDDLITYRLADDEYLIVPNASNTPADVEAFTKRVEAFLAANPGADVTVTDESADTALIAVQGPASEDILLTTQDTEEGRNAIKELAYYAWAPLKVGGLDILLARTGYTGEDGFELYLPNAGAEELWNVLTKAGADFDLKPAGLAARDSLRLEAGMPLFGNELTNDITPVEAGMGGMVAGALKNKTEFVGREALEKLDTSKVDRTLVGLSSSGRRAARTGAELKAGETTVGVITSGQPSPTLGHPIALAYVDVDQAETGTELEADIRGKRYPFTVVETPFYRRES